MSTTNEPTTAASRVELTDEEWRARLTPERYAVLRQKGTEPAWSGELLHVEGSGMFTCAGCGAELFPTDDQVRLRVGLAELHPGAGRGHHRGARGRLVRHEADRDHLRQVRRPPRPRVPRRSGADRAALLRQLAVAGVRACRGLIRSRSAPPLTAHFPPPRDPASDVPPSGAGRPGAVRACGRVVRSGRPAPGAAHGSRGAPRRGEERAEQVRLGGPPDRTRTRPASARAWQAPNASSLVRTTRTHGTFLPRRMPRP